MSIRNEDEGRQKQQRQREARRGKEAEARPDALHRAVIFLLRAAKENNPDLSEEAKHHMATLDAELAIPEKLVEIEKTESAAPTEEEAAPAAPKPNTAAAIQQSKRFKRG